MKADGDGMEAFVESGSASGKADFSMTFEPFFANFLGVFDVVGFAAQLTCGAGELGGVV